jgi:hypothetical protein
VIVNWLETVPGGKVYKGARIHPVMGRGELEFWWTVQPHYFDLLVFVLGDLGLSNGFAPNHCYTWHVPSRPFRSDLRLSWN